MGTKKLSSKELNDLKKQYRERDRVIKGLTKDGKFRLSAIKNTEAARTAQKRHNLPPIPAHFLARALAAASMTASFLKGEERISLEFEGAGKIKKIYAEAIQVGEQRGYVEYDPSISGSDYSNIGDFLGAGLIKVVRILYNRSEPLASAAPLYKGDLASDLAYYFAQSEQIPSAVILDAEIGDDGIVSNSGGILVQAMPGAQKEDIEKIISALENSKSLAEYWKKGLSVEEAAKEALRTDFDVLSSSAIDFYCRCSKESFMEKLLTLDYEEIKDMKAKGQNELVCKYCGAKYYLTDGDFKKLLTETKAKKN